MNNQPYPTFFENEPLSAHPRHFPLTGTAKPRFARGTFSYFKNQWILHPDFRNCTPIALRALPSVEGSSAMRNKKIQIWFVLNLWKDKPDAFPDGQVKTFRAGMYWYYQKWFKCVSYFTPHYHYLPIPAFSQQKKAGFLRSLFVKRLRFWVFLWMLCLFL